MYHTTATLSISMTLWWIHQLSLSMFWWFSVKWSVSATTVQSGLLQLLLGSLLWCPRCLDCWMSTVSGLSSRIFGRGKWHLQMRLSIFCFKTTRHHCVQFTFTLLSPPNPYQFTPLLHFHFDPLFSLVQAEYSTSLLDVKHSAKLFSGVILFLGVVRL